MDGEKITIDLMVYCRLLLSLNEAFEVLSYISGIKKEDWIFVLTGRARKQTRKLTDEDKEKLSKLFMKGNEKHE
ncbi:MAG: hypothetical protein RM368_27955 [Nostoc sp. DedSLP03]|uniref:hypothetical protein n=1 Tax=Nostoc sp. DedSLP03 TaxID=3075400 RepID=UPI002AD254C1|nr:hypothetical protein [Nostoc sp. DedSLP03]MDZ7968742.1 hypothetical protein [Nostoc sp. DedSLP03]